jgi:drug/metabolite transporter (DMT)-like permease
LLSVLFGFSVAITQLMQTKAMGSGPASLVTLIYSCGFLVPIFYGVIFWNESVSTFQWGGVVLLIIALCLILKKGKKKQESVKWLPFAIAAMLGSGTNAILQKTHQYSDFAEELPFFLVYSMFFSTVFIAIASFIIRDPERIRSRFFGKEALKKIWIPLCLGVCVGALNFINLVLAGKLPSVIHFPVYNVGSMLLTSGISAMIYQDKPSKKQGIGFAVGIAAILVIGLL